MNTDTVNVCGPNIARLRSQAKPPLTQESLAAKMQTLGAELDRATIAKIETQKRKVFDTEIILFAKALNVSPQSLLNK